MSFCPNCGVELNENSNFCPGCGYKIKISNFDNNNKSPKFNNSLINSNSEYKSNILLPISFVLFFILVLASPGIGMIFLFVSWYFLYADSKKLGAGNCAIKETYSPMTWKPFSWLLFTIFFWIISYPYYMYKRREIWSKNQAL